MQADEAAFRKTQESERAKLAQIRKVQENVDRTREQNAKRKMDKIQSREWDSGKPTSDLKRRAEKPESVHDVVTAAGGKDSFIAEPGSPSRDMTGRTRGRGISQRSRGKVKALGSGVGRGVEGFPTKSPSSSIPRDDMETSQQTSP